MAATPVLTRRRNILTKYGKPDNATRPGGPLTTAVFTSNIFSNTTIWLLSDNSTIVSLIWTIQFICVIDLSNNGSIIATPYNGTKPTPFEAVQYYRASSVVLALDGYNNTAALSADDQPDVPLPSGTDVDMLACLNDTVASHVPLVDAAVGLRFTFSVARMSGLVWVVGVLIGGFWVPFV
ncbi:hypothetical protein BDQ17DRAFT_1363585 [Cyathus striatus]|nr:hypothetical protein BDQ17DRAFT_1363585 [Cyathus striatus]